MFKHSNLFFYIVFYGITVGICFTISTLCGLSAKSNFIHNLPHFYKDHNCFKCPNVNEAEGDSPDDITYITVPRSFINEDQRNKYELVISSWLSSSPKSKVILYAPEDEIDTTGKLQKDLIELFGENRVFYKGYIKSDQDGVPYVDDWFRRGIDDATTKYVCFINTDILLSSQWLRRVKQVYKVFKETDPLVLINQRIDFDLHTNTKHLKYNASNFLEEIDNIVENSPKEEHPPTGMDTFTFKKDPLPFNVDTIPPFIVGRYNWDNWMVGYLNTIAKTVSFNIDPPIYHINHIRHDFDTSDPRVAANDLLRKMHYDYFASNTEATYSIKNGILYSKFGQKTILPRDII